MKKAYGLQSKEDGSYGEWLFSETLGWKWFNLDFPKYCQDETVLTVGVMSWMLSSGPQSEQGIEFADGNYDQYEWVPCGHFKD